jgi:hypothetical protein
VSLGSDDPLSDSLGVSSALGGSSVELGGVEISGLEVVTFNKLLLEGSGVEDISGGIIKLLSFLHLDQ